MHISYVNCDPKDFHEKLVPTPKQTERITLFMLSVMLCIDATYSLMFIRERHACVAPRSYLKEGKFDQ